MNSARRLLLALVVAACGPGLTGEAHAKGKKLVRVNLHEQKLYAYEGDKLVWSFNCVTGRKGHLTEPGKFLVFRKEEKHFSKKYKAEMPHSLFFSRDGKAIHAAGKIDVEAALKRKGRDDVGSHGCVHLSPAHARTLFEWAGIGTVVEVVKK